MHIFFDKEGDKTMAAAIERAKPDALDHRLPTPEEIDSAAHAAAALANSLDANGALVVAGTEDNELHIAPAISGLMIDLLTKVASGNMVTLVPTGADLTTTQAASMLNVSRPFLTKLLKRGDIDHFMVGTHRRIKFEDVMAYKAKRDEEQSGALDELAALGQEIDAD
ncbi:MAG: helix-turn-helix domain-containing protein [Roseibium sp.]|uniref:helix-turn-helix domain-containing protein n=1 Tax=Roseibium sp. TaxID=1936156 RepID=UPI0026275C2F|nr:helix-turn-helix domain-containing protein [Roseibium sp.]MCV0427191.1 helix-turn-helix domain-containing protein [Roseibium sp.]